MSKGNYLYVVHAGDSSQAYCPIVYETTKEAKAYEFVHDLEKSETNYTKIYIERKPLKNFDKRTDWD